MAVLSLATPEAQQQYGNKLNTCRTDVNKTQTDIAAITFDFKQVPGLSQITTPWQAIQEKYKNARWASRDNATNISTGLEQLATTHLAFAAGVEQASPEETVEILNSWISDNESLTTEAKGQIAKFNETLDALKKYKENTIQPFAAEQQSIANSTSKELSDLNQQAAPLRQEVQGINDQISAIQDEIQDIQKELDKIGAHPILPSSKKRKEELEKQLKEKQDELAKAQANLQTAQSNLNVVETKIAPIQQRHDAAQKNWDVIVKNKPSIDNITNTRVQSIINQLSIFQEIHAGANNDVKECAAYIQGGKKSAVPTVLAVYNKDGPNTYGPIRQSLVDYATKVGSD